MGACGSKVEEEEPVVSEQTDKSTKSSTPEDKGEKKGEKKGGGEDKEASNADFLETLKGVIILILNRLVTALEYEQEGFLDLATKRSKKKLHGAHRTPTLRKVVTRHIRCGFSPAWST